jgi:threonine/homoserine/homoserine lactone efflux protein
MYKTSSFLPPSVFGMDAGWLAAVVAFSMVSSVTPGPNNLLLWASGASAGFARTVPHVVGTALGLGLMALLVAAGLGAVVTSVPAVTTVLKVLGSVYLLWLAWRLLGAGAFARGTVARPMTVWQAIAFQLVNAKAWIFALGAITTFSPAGMPGLAGGALVAAIMALVILPTAALWAGAGGALARIVDSPRARRIVNVSLATLLVASVATVWL